MKQYTQYSLLQHNTFGIDALCQRFVSFETVEEITTTFPANAPQEPYLILGGGSNLLLTRNFNGTVLHVDIKGMEAQVSGNSILLRCGAGEVWDDVVAQCVVNGWHGAENLSLIPGTVGASAVQNIGAYGVEVKDIIEEVEAVEIATGKTIRISNDDCHYAYRQSRFKNEWRNKYLITHVTYRLSTQFCPKLDYGNIRTELMQRGIVEPTAHELRQTIVDLRNQKLPDVKQQGNAGSFFVNPIIARTQFAELQQRYPDAPHYDVDPQNVKIPAGWLIEKAGWKGRSKGRAGVHSKQALVLVNLGGATGQEVLDLCQTIRQDVKSMFNIDIQPEVNII